MNRPPDLPKNLRLIDLGRESDIVIRGVRIRPSRLQVMTRGAEETIQPRVMQVLIALVRARGEVVTREELIECCWEGLTVGDDSISRCIAKIRQLAKLSGAESIDVETIPRVGYRLRSIEVETTQEKREAKTSEQSAGRMADASADATTSPRIRTGIAWTAGAAAIAVLLAWAWWPASSDITVGIEAAGFLSSDFAPGLVADLARLTGAANRVSFKIASDDNRPDFRLKILAHREGPTVFADGTLLKSGSSDLLWTSSFALPSHNFPALRQQIANAAARVISCGMRTGSHLRYSNATTLRLLLTACEALDDRPDNPEQSAVELWRKLAQSDPNNAAAMASLAFLEAELGWPVSDNSPRAAAFRAAARKHLQRARSIDDRLGMSYAAEAALLPPWRYRDRLAVLNYGLTLDPDCAVLHNLKSGALRDVGELEDAVASARTAVELEPSSAAHRQNLISALMYAGYIETAKVELESAERIWPNSFTIKEVRSRFDFRFGDQDRQIRNIDSGSVIPNTSAEWQKWMRTFLLARAKPTSENVEAAANAAVAFVRRGGSPQVPLQSIVALGRTEDAYKLLEVPHVITDLRQEGADILFRVNMRAFRLDRRFIPLANRLGLLEYWQSSDHWPDFCDDKDLPYDCKAEGRQLRLKPS